MPAISENLSRYIAAVNRIEPLSRQSELELSARFESRRDPAARSALVRAHLRAVVAIALKYRRYGVPLDELVAEGNLGVLHALEKFEPGRGIRFVTYASYWIRAYMLNHVIRSFSMVGAGAGALRSKVFFKLRRERAKIVGRVGEGEHADALLARTLKLPEAKVTAMVRHLENRDVSLDAPTFDGSTASLAERLVSPEQSPEELAARREKRRKLRSVLGSALAKLDERERFIVENRLVSEREDELSLAEIGRRLGVSRERARQLEGRTRSKLRTHLEQALGTSAAPADG